METLKVKSGGKFYLIFNLTIQEIREFDDDPQKLSQHFKYCLETGTNICLLEDSNAPSTSAQTPCTWSSVNANDATSTASNGKNHRFDFLCRAIDNHNYIYGIKSDQHPWHYFDEQDSVCAQHGLILTSLYISINQMASIATITVSLDDAQMRHYFKNGKFIFKNKELKTYLEIVKEPIENQTSKSSEKSTKRLVFISGQTNPLLFLNEFEKCNDINCDKDKMYEILHFVDECHKGQFTELYFNSDWQTSKSKFLQLYTLSFIKNKKRDLNIEFNGSNTLRSFVDQKLTNLAKYTTLPFINRIEILMNDLPEEISSLFIVYEKMTCNKSEILKFCDSIQELVQNYHEKSKDTTNEIHQESGQPSNRMEIEVFHFISEEESISPKPSRGRGRGNGGVRRGRTTKRGSSYKTIVEDKESSDSFSFLDEMDDSSRSTWSQTN